MVTRENYTEEEDEEMVRFWEKQLKKGNQDAKRPKGLKLWEKFAEAGLSKRPPGNLASHFGRKVLPKLTMMNIPTKLKINVYRLWKGRLENTDKQMIEKYSRCTITLNEGKICWTYRKKADQRKEKDVEMQQMVGNEDNDNNSAKNRNTVSILSSDEDEILPPKKAMEKTAPSTPISSMHIKKVPQTKVMEKKTLSAQISRDITRRTGSVESMPNAEDFEFTREIEDIKRQCRVRRSLREHLGCPPMSTPTVKNMEIEIVRCSINSIVFEKETSPTKQGTTETNFQGIS